MNSVPDPPDADAHRERQQLIDEVTAAVVSKLASPPAGGTVSELVGAFLAKRRPKLEAGSYENYRYALEAHFATGFGSRDVSTLAADEIEAWEDRPDWSRSYRNNTLGAVMTFLRWAKHPLAIARPPKESRGSAAVLSDEQFATVLAAYDVRSGGDFRELLRLLRETGARPQEAARLTVEAIDWPNRLAKLARHKSERHGRPRTIHFSDTAVTILEAQRSRHKTGWLFRTTRGNRYRKKAIVLNMLRISERVGFRAIAYGLGRHSFATRALSRGVPDTVVAALLGHATTQMIHSNYSHVAEQSRVLKDALKKASGG